MQHLGDFRIDDYITFGVQLHRFSSGAVYAPTGSVTYTFYEDNSTSGAPTGGNLAQLNSKTGLYTARVQLTTASGFEAGKDYFIHVEATVDSVAAGELFMFRVVDVPTVDVTSLGGSTQSATDLKDFADAGYDPSAHKVQGVVLTDTVTTYTGNTPQTGDTYAKVDTEVAALQSDLTAVKAKTDNLPSDPADASDIAASFSTVNSTLSTIAGYIDTEVSAIKTVTDAIGATGAGLSAIPWNAAWDAEVQSECADAITAASVSTLTAAQVNAEVVDALATDTYAEPGQGTPGATISLAQKIGYIYKWLRNKKTQTATTKSIYNDDASTVDHKCTVSDDGTTYTETEITSGP